MRTTPPRRAAALLERRLHDCAWRESILGDLDEEYFAKVRRGSRLRADLWYWQQAIRLPRDRKLCTRSTAPAQQHPMHSTGWRSLRGFMSELALAFRSALKQPGHTALVILALALGLGLNAAVYGMGDALVARPYPIPGIDRLVIVGDMRPGAFDTLSQNASPANFLDWKAASSSGGPIEQIVAWEYWDGNLSGGSQPERVQAQRVSPGFFQMLGGPIQLGREFAEGEDVPGRASVAVLGYGLWQRRFGGDASIVGRTVSFDSRPVTIVGIAPERFSFPQGTEVWIPLSFTAEQRAVRGRRHLTVAAKLREGATIDDARAHIGVIAARLKRDYPAENGQQETYVHTFAQGMGDPGASNLMLVWQASAAIVLLIACGNVASLLLARGAARSREIAVRLAMGASRWRLVRLMLVESLALATLAIPLSLGLAWWLLKIIKSYMPARIAAFVLGWDQIDLDGRVVLFTIAAALLTTIVFGLLPALQSSKLGMVDTLKQGGRGSTSGRLRLRKVLVTAQIALALPLLVAAGMTALGTYRFINGAQGYDPHGVLTFRVSLPSATYTNIAQRARFAEQVEQALAATPGVTSAAAVNILPSAGSNWSSNYEIDGDPPLPPGAQPHNADYRVISPSYLETMRIPLTRGRNFSSVDTAAGQSVAIVSEAFVARHWPGQDPIGRRIVFPGRERVVATIVGVSGDVIQDWFARRDYPTIFRPVAQSASITQAFAVRTNGDPAALAPDVRAAVAKVDPQQAIYQVAPQWQNVWERSTGPRYAAGMMALFGVLALVLSVIGIYALIGYYVTQRRQEIGVRMALGAQRGDVVRLTVRQAAVMAAAGIAIGGAAAFAISRVLESAMFGIAQSDPRLLAIFAATLGITALAAGYIPARRAASIDPMIAMRLD